MKVWVPHLPNGALALRHFPRFARPRRRLILVLTEVSYDKRRYRRRNRIEIMFGRLKDWRRVATRYDRCPTVFFSAVALAATVIFWL
jgi:transposase